jgi:hypothetical protein
VKKATALHEEAMILADRADKAREALSLEAARELYRQAFELERSAALQFLRKPDVEPTRSVLFRSAASLALDCGEFLEAEKMVCHGLAADPPADLRAELRQLYEQMHFRVFLQDSQLRLMGQQIVVSLWGDAVNPDFVPLREVLDRLKRAERLIYRTAERKSGIAFSEEADSPMAIRQRFPVFQRMQRAASYAVVLQVGQSDMQLSLPFAADAAEIVSEVVDCIGLYNSEDISGLEQRIEDSAYRRNFASIVKRMYPRTPGISGVGIAGMTSQGKMKVVELVHPPQARIVKPLFEPQEAEAGQPLQIIGQLFLAQSTPRIKRVGIIDDNGDTHTIDVPEGMLADVVRPYFEARVVADVMKASGGALSLVDVHGESESASEQGGETRNGEARKN